MSKVKELMSADVACCSSNESLAEAARIFWERDCGFVPVTNPETGRTIGVVTDRDACIASYTQGLSLRDIPVTRAMSSRLLACGPDDDLSRAHDLMRREQLRRLPVLDGEGRCVGVVSLNDLARAATRSRSSGADPRADARVEVAATLGAVCQPRAIAASA